MRVLVTGGAGFVGSWMCELAREKYPKAEIVAFDNLKRRGSELNLSRLKEWQVSFVHGDVRKLSDLEDLSGNFDWVIEASAEPSVLSGVNSTPAYVLDTNYQGCANCLEFLRKRGGFFSFLSTSRVYSIEALQSLKTKQAETRLEWMDETDVPGFSQYGIGEDFSTRGFRSFYGMSKLAAEMLIEEYAHAYGISAVVNRCGVIAGPGQFGKVDQGVFTLWVANHHFNKPLRYTGFGGAGLQVRDLLHPRDLADLLVKQFEAQEQCRTKVYNVGGGLEGSVSLRELTDLCRDATGKKVPIAQDDTSHIMDLPLYYTDTRKVEAELNWAPKTRPASLVKEIADWLQFHEKSLKPLFVRE